VGERYTPCKKEGGIVRAGETPRGICTAGNMYRGNVRIPQVVQVRKI